jgi:hypothetical protein
MFPLEPALRFHSHQNPAIARAGKIMLLEQALLLDLLLLADVAQAMTAALAAGRRSMDWMGGAYMAARSAAARHATCCS